MKIIIVGAGVSGLSTYLQFCKVLPAFDSHTVLVYESHKPSRTATSGSPYPSLSKAEDLTDSTVVVGNTIGLAPNGVRLLKYIDTGLYEKFKAQGYTSQAYTFKTARGHTLGVASTGDKGSPEEFTISCPRYGLWECLHEVVGEDKIQHRKVIAVELDGEKPIVKFADGGQEDADLVIGADGVRSVVKRGIFGAENEHAYAPHYEGFCGVGSFVSTEIPEAITKHNSMVFTFGPTGSFGYCSAAPLSQRKLGWWSNWATPQPPLPSSNVLKPSEIRTQLQSRHGNWKDPVIQYIIENMTTDRVYPIWTTPNLPHWGKSGAVLLGDAAHTLQATSGQGACQALEDSVVFSLLLAGCLDKAEDPKNDLTVKEAVDWAIRGVYEIRNPRVGRIKSHARNLFLTKRKIESVVVEYLFYAFIYLWTNFSVIGTFLLGNIFQTLNEEPSLETQVQAYLANKNHPIHTYQKKKAAGIL